MIYTVSLSESKITCSAQVGLSISPTPNRCGLEQARLVTGHFWGVTPSSMLLQTSPGSTAYYAAKHYTYLEPQRNATYQHSVGLT